MIGNSDPRTDEEEVESAWETKIDSDGEIGHFVYPVEAKQRGITEITQKKLQDKVYLEPLPPGTAKGRERMVQPSQSKDNDSGEPKNSHPYSTQLKTQGNDLNQEEKLGNPQLVQKFPQKP